MSSYETGVNVILGGSVGPRIRVALEEYAGRKGMPLREYVKTRTGFMAALLALNKLAGMRVYDVVEEEAFDESSILARRKGPNFILDDQSHIFFRKGGYADASPEGLQFLETLGGMRKSIVTDSQGIIDATKDTWVKEVFFLADTDVTFLNTLAFGEYFGGKDYFGTEECVEVAKEVNELYPGRVLTLGTIEPNREGHLEKLEYYVKELKMTGLKLYPWDATSKGGWWADDEKLAYPLWQKCLQLGIDKIHIHKGIPASFTMAKYVHPLDLDQPIRDFPKLNFIVYHAGFPYIDELISINIGRSPRANLYVDLGSTFALLVNTPVALAHTMGKLLRHIGADHICWGTDTPIWGPPQWQIEALRKLTIPDELMAGYGYPEFTDADKELIFGKNMARLYGLDIDEVKNQVKNDAISQARRTLL
jgi:predicted TIM-barrel fold metal-dependent hydrolase